MSDTGKMECQKVCLSKMNEAQRQAVTHGEGPLLLLAGPGSGKTYTITNRILYLLEKGMYVIPSISERFIPCFIIFYKNLKFLNQISY